MALTFPQTNEILELVELLIGEKPAFSPGEGWDLTAPEAGCCITFLLGKDKKVAGAVVTNLPANLYLGGKLAQLPPDKLARQAQKGRADERVVAAVAEVAANLRTLIVGIDGNPEVSSTRTYSYQVPTADDLVGWIRSPAKRVDYVGDTDHGKATLTLICP